jgi:FkbM family methyltransferase
MGRSRAEDPTSVDRASFNEVWLEGTYDVRGVPGMDARHIIDIGAHIGTASIYFASKSPKARIIACEPLPANYQLLETNIRINGLQDRIQTLPIAISNRPSIVKLRVGETSGTSWIDDDPGEARSVRVRALTLRQLLDDYSISTCDLLKLDCEGAEYSILYGASRDVFDRLRTIVLEYHRRPAITGGDGESLGRYLTQRGFRVSYARKRVLIARQQPDPTVA